MNSLRNIDVQLFLYLNGKHNSFFDGIMFWVSHRFFWIPLYLFFLFLVLHYFKKKSWLIFFSVGLLVVLSDQISVRAFKNVVKRNRPCHNPELIDKIHLNDGCGGQYGFVSSHAANTFALAMFMSLIFRRKFKYFMPLIFIWAGFVSYSRIYNGVHYPADVACGAILGMGVGIAVYKLMEYAANRWHVNLIDVQQK